LRRKFYSILAVRSFFYFRTSMQGFSLALTLLVLISPMPLGYNLGANGAVSNGSEETVGAAGLDAMASGGLDAGVPSFAKVSEVFQVCLVEPV
jgi:hypothetical protein